MFSRVLRAALVVGLVAAGWAVGYAQAPAQASAQAPTQAPAPSPTPAPLGGFADFELLVTAGNGQTEVRCIRGCRLTWAPTVQPKEGPVEMLAPDLKVRGNISKEGCLSPTWMQNCHILGFKQ